MDQCILEFFDGHMDALPLYEQFEKRVFSEIGPASIKVLKTQISFSNKYLFACVSFARIRKKKDCPDTFIVITLGLDHKIESSRIDVATEPYPGRWTHHILIAAQEEIDDELMRWVKEASVFSASKNRKKRL